MIAEPSLRNAPAQLDSVPLPATSACQANTSACAPPGIMSPLPLSSPGAVTFEAMPFDVAAGGLEVIILGFFGPAFLAFEVVLGLEELPPQATSGRARQRRTILRMVIPWRVKTAALCHGL